MSSQPARSVWFLLTNFAAILFLSGRVIGLAEPLGTKLSPGYGFVEDPLAIQINAGILQRTVSLTNGNVTNVNFKVAGHDCLGAHAREVSFLVSFAEPNERPKGLTPNQTAAIETSASISAGTDALQVTAAETNESSGVKWVQEHQIQASAWAAQFDAPRSRITQRTTNSQCLQITARARDESPLAGLQIVQCFEIYDGFPAIRKWLEISNGGKRWIKLNKLVIDDLEFSADYRHQTPLTPGERGAGPSVIAFGTPDGARGVLAVSEIPSALRQIEVSGAMGYSDEWFEWVLGPGENFVSEPVFWFAYNGEVQKTISSVSTPRDRAVERGYMEFLRQHVGVAADRGDIDAPQWCSWSNFGQKIDDRSIREQAEIAGRCGFALLLLDQGWQKDLVGTQPDTNKFPDFAATARYIRAQGLKLGLWVACYRHPDSPDLRAMPEARSLPVIRRDGGVGMSFASPWKKFYAADLARVSREYGATYFKQDFTNLKFGDIAEGHESRTRQESLLRGLRGLLEAQDLLRQKSPGIASQVTHEIYWGTPGVPCDVAVLKHAAAYHIPPNDYAGVGQTKMRVSEKWNMDPAQLRAQLIRGCFNARQRFYAHRGLPLYALEYYGAHAVNFRGSLTPGIQDRQICSWLMGAPVVFAGDLASLTEENIQRYRARFDLLRRLEQEHGIYRNFQFSGVPAPTDTDWHWWGKLNQDGSGAVIVIRGTKGAEKRAVNIPWVQADRDYEVASCLNEKPLGSFKGSELQNGKLQLELPPVGQEILELRLVR